MNLLKLNAGRIDFYINDIASILMVVKMLKEKKELPENALFPVAYTIKREPAYLMFVKNDNGKFKFKKDFIEKFNKALIEFKKNGGIEKIVEKYTR